jgi:hypothetical protein
VVHVQRGVWCKGAMRAKEAKGPGRGGELCMQEALGTQMAAAGKLAWADTSQVHIAFEVGGWVHMCTWAWKCTCTCTQT